MSLYHAVELLVVGAAVGASAWALAVRLLPRLRRKRAGTGSGGCSSCDSCGNCGSSPREQAAPPPQQPIRFHPRDR